MAAFDAVRRSCQQEEELAGVDQHRSTLQIALDEIFESVTRAEHELTVGEIGADRYYQRKSARKEHGRELQIVGTVVAVIGAAV